MEYNMSHKNWGYAVIFNHEFIDFQVPRTGTNVDCENLTEELSRLHFDVESCKDLRKDEIRDKMIYLSSLDHSENDCILIAILSHGEYGGIVFAKDKYYSVDYLTSFFTADKCPSLAGKPKLFFIQACQGDNDQTGVNRSSRIKTDSSIPTISYTLPAYADFLIVFSTIPGYVSYRDTVKGGWFIQSLCDQLRINGTRYSIMDLLTHVIQ